MRMRNYAPHTFKSDAFVYLTIQKCSYSKYLTRSFQSNLINLGPSACCRWSWCRPCLLVWVGRLLRLRIRGFARFFGIGLLCIRYSQRQEQSDRLLQGRRQWFTRLSRAWSEMVPSGLVAVYPPISTRAGETANHRRHEHAAQKRWRASDRVCRPTHLRCHPRRERYQGVPKAHYTSP